jgi:hypothetical protein
LTTLRKSPEASKISVRYTNIYVRASLTCEEELEISVIVASFVALNVNDIQCWYISKQVLSVEHKLFATLTMKNWLTALDEPFRKPFSVP